MNEGFEVPAGYSPEKFGWVEDTDKQGVGVSAFPDSRVDSYRQVFTRGGDTLSVVWKSPTRVTAWKKNGRAGDLALHKFLAAVQNP